MHDPTIPTWEPTWHTCPNADANGTLHNVDLEMVGGYRDSLPDLPTDEDLDRAARERARLLDEGRGMGL